MWIIVVSLFTVYGVVSGDPDICAKAASDICIPQEESGGFPGSIEALDKMCPAATATLRCLVDYKNQCGTDFPGTIDDSLDQVYELASDACDKDSELHQELSIRLPCIQRVLMSNHNSCRTIVDESMEAIRSRIHGGDDIDEDSPEVWRKFSCMYEALHVACLVADTSVTCGEATKELIERIVDRVNFLDSVCHADIREDVKEMVSIMQVEMEEGLALRNMISKA